MATFNTRIALKIDTLENWNKSTFNLMKGEVAIATASATAGSGLSEPVQMIKIGDGTKKFSELDWALYAKASDVYSWAKAATKPTYTADEISGLANYISGQIQDTDNDHRYAFAVVDGKLQVTETPYVKGVAGTPVVKTYDFATAAEVTSAIDTALADYYEKSEVDALIQGAKDYADKNDADTTYTFASGTTNGAFNVTPKGGTAQSVKVYGLGTAAYTASSAYDAAGAAAAVLGSTTDASTAKTVYGAIALANSKDSAIAAAKKAGDDAQTTANSKITSAQAKSQIEAYGYATKTEAQGYANAKDTAISKAQSDATSALTKINTFLADADMTTNAVDTLKELQEYMASHGSDAAGMVSDIADNAAAIEDIIDGTTTVAKATNATNATTATNATQLGGTAASSYALKTYVDTAESDAVASAKSYADGLAKNYATAAQGTAASTAVQSVTFAGKALTKTGTTAAISQADARTALGLGSAAYAATTAFDAAGAADDALAAAKTYADTAEADALAAAKTYADGKITALDSSVSATSGSVLTGVTITDGKLSAKTEKALATVATSGKIDDLTQTGVLVFNCGTSTTVI